MAPTADPSTEAVDLSQVDDVDLPVAMFRLRATVEVGSSARVTFARPIDDRIRLVIAGSGFELTSRRGAAARLTRWRTLADSVRPGMRLLMIGLNPSLHSADSGIGYFRGGNRFWPAMLAAELVTHDRDPLHALGLHDIGMTDFVKRATPRVVEVDDDEFRVGVERVVRLAEWLEPRAICAVGLAGWRAGVDRKATAGWQDRELGGRPVYVMPSTSGLNAHAQLPVLVEHLQRAAADSAG